MLQYASSVVCLRDVVLVVLTTSGHGVCASESREQSSSGELAATQTQRLEGSAEQHTVRGSGASEVGCCLLAWM
jgi:hypothetical protein